MSNIKSKYPIVVMTPVRNEEWILDRFLSVTSQFADYIIIADQDSWDETPKICKRYEKVTLIRNNAPAFNEAERQILLIQKARDLIPGEKILLALDADEILASDSLESSSWQNMLKAEPGTVLYFQKVDLTPSIHHFYAWDTSPAPLGYIDDGAEHRPKKIHSTRIPVPNKSAKLYLDEANILHYGFTRSRNQRSRRRFYSVVENVMQLSSVWSRRSRYGVSEDFSQHPQKECHAQWFQGWENIGIDMRTVTDPEFYWQDFEVLRYFNRYGTQRFWLDDLWDFDWKACCNSALEQGLDGVSLSSIQPPPKPMTWAAERMMQFYRLSKQLKT